ncbi:MAG: hypothetical protein ACR2H3_17330 [Acidimicrobiales bacterium]
MDPLQLLGLGPESRDLEVKAAHRRLAAHLRAGGATAEIRRVVDDAAAAVLRGGVLPRPIDPVRILGVRLGASVPELKAAYRTQARLCHPDLGGTDELFRIVGHAVELLAPRGREPGRPMWDPDGSFVDRRHRTQARPSWHGIRFERPPKPPPPKPFVAPPPERRVRPSRVRAGLDLAMHLAVVLALIGAVGAVAVLWRFWALVAIAAIVMSSGQSLRPLIDGLARAVIRFRAGPSRISAGAGSPITFLEQTCLDAPVNRVSEDDLYSLYAEWCVARQRLVVSQWAFIEQLRSLGLLYVKATSWEGGVWVGLKVSDEALA